jgi:hypothetical protein
MQDPLLLGKLKYQGFLNAVVPGDLLYVIDSISKRRYLVDTGASFSVLPFFSATAPTGLRLSGPYGASILCLGYKRHFLVFGRHHFVWRFLLTAIKFPIIGMDFSKHFHLLVDPAGQQLVDSVSHESITAMDEAAAPSTAAMAMQVATCMISCRRLRNRRIGPLQHQQQCRWPPAATLCGWLKSRWTRGQR